MIISPSAIGSSVPLCQTFCLGKTLLQAATTSKLVIQLGLWTARNIHIWTKIKRGLSIHKSHLLAILFGSKLLFDFLYQKTTFVYLLFSLFFCMKKSLFLIGISTSLLLLVGCGQSTVVPTAPVPNLFATGGTNSENFQEITGTET